MENTPELQDHRIGHLSNDLYTARRVARLGMANTPELQDHHIRFNNMKHKVQTELLDKFKHKIKECVLLAQEAHASSKSHHELNIWQRVSLLKVKLPKTRLTQQVINEVSIKIKALIQVVNKSN
jgi:hypothetical protein